jgi:hypothetical protein
MSRRLALLPLLAAVASGCALCAKRPDTPAGHIDRVALAQTPPTPNVRHYLILFGSEAGCPKKPELTHTWATLVTATCVPGGGEPHLDVETISWLPANLHIRPDSKEVEPGKNFDLETTLGESVRTNQDIAMWGPYEVWHGFAHRFRVQKEFLESGRVGYQCIDSRGEAARTGTGHNCIHAVTDMDPLFGRGRYILAFYGQAATRNFLGRLMKAPEIIDPPTTHDWIVPRIGLDRYPIVKREYRGPTVAFTPEAALRAGRAAERIGEANLLRRAGVVRER